MRGANSVEGSGQARNRALRILVGYIVEILGVRAVDIGAPFVTGSDTGDRSRINYAKMVAFLRGQTVLSEVDYDVLKQRAAAILNSRRYHQTLISDYFFLRSVLHESGIDTELSLFRSERDESVVDVEFLRTFQSNVRMITNDDQTALHDRIGGLWYVIRPSTDAQTPRELDYNISLINIKPTRYVSALKGEYENVVTHLVHFSFRSQFGRKESGVLQLYRGRVLEVNKAIYFLGERHHIGMPSLFMMAWAMPVQEIGRRGEGVHAQTVKGVIMTGNASDIPIVSPMIGQHIPLEGNKQRAPNISDTQWGREEADHHERMINLYATNIGVYSEHDIYNIAEIKGEKVISTLKMNVERGKAEGFFRIFP
jgi:hypothetical protein